MGYLEEQTALYDRVQRGQVRVVEHDPDGTFPEDWLAVALHHPTGVICVNRCAGVACQQRMVEGYLVMLGATAINVDELPTRNHDLIAVFHQDGACMYSWSGADLPEDRMQWLARLVRQIGYWSNESGLGRLELDLARRDEIAEAWIPVTSPDGPGVLIYQNCD